MTAEPIIVLDKKDAETFTDNRPAKKDLAIELKEKGIEFDLSNMSYEDAMKMAMTQATFSRVALLNERLKMENPSPSLLDEIITLSRPEALEAIYAQAREQMAKIVKRLPREWFISSAPKDLPLDNPDTYKHLRADKANDLRRLITRAENEAKN